MQWHDECTQIKWIKVSVLTILTKRIPIFHVSPFLISHPNRFRSADLGDSFPPGEAMGRCRASTLNYNLQEKEEMKWTIRKSII